MAIYTRSPEAKTVKKYAAQQSSCCWVAWAPDEEVLKHENPWILEHVLDGVRDVDVQSRGPLEVCHVCRMAMLEQ